MRIPQWFAGHGPMRAVGDLQYFLLRACAHGSCTSQSQSQNQSYHAELLLTDIFFRIEGNDTDGDKTGSYIGRAEAGKWVIGLMWLWVICG